MSIDDYKHSNVPMDTKPFQIKAEVSVTDRLTVLTASLGEAFRFPTKARETDAGWDLYASEDVRLFPLLPRKIKTDVGILIPEGYVGLILDRSGLGSSGIHHLAGVVDNGYVGEIKVALVNLSLRFWRGYKIKRGDRIAQIVIVKMPITELEVVAKLPETDRGDKGFGSSGK